MEPLLAFSVGRSPLRMSLRLLGKPTTPGLLVKRLREDRGVSLAGIGASESIKRAIRAFAKAGFRLFREFQDPECGSCVYMVVEC